MIENNFDINREDLQDSYTFEKFYLTDRLKKELDLLIRNDIEAFKYALSLINNYEAILYIIKKDKLNDLDYENLIELFPDHPLEPLFKDCLSWKREKFFRLYEGYEEKYNEFKGTIDSNYKDIAHNRTRIKRYTA